MSLQTPRVLPAHLHAFHPSSAGGRSTSTVRLLGTVSALHGDTATITCGGNGDVTLALRPDSHLQMGKLVEVVGKVMDLEGGVCYVISFFCFCFSPGVFIGPGVGMTWTVMLIIWGV